MSEQEKKALVKASIKCLLVASEFDDTLTNIDESHLVDVINPKFFNVDDLVQTLEWYQELASEAHKLLSNLPQLKDVDWNKEIEKYHEESEKK